jgi:hypothetical protein
VSENWPNNVSVGCKAPFNLVELKEFNVGLLEELEEFERSLEQDEWKET